MISKIFIIGVSDPIFKFIDIITFKILGFYYDNVVLEFVDKIKYFGKDRDSKFS